MFKFEHSVGPEPKIHATIGSLPAWIDPKQPPTKKKPFGVIRECAFVHSLDMILPGELYDSVWKKVEEALGSVQYVKVIMPLASLLEGDFFTLYIKRGNVLMLSEGRPGVDNIFRLKDGILQLELDKESYERAGLVGNPVRSGGRKHVKTRYLVEINLRQPSMLHGKKGFERVVWAAKNVLNHSKSWLFCDLQQGRNDSEGDTATTPIFKYHPEITYCTPRLATLEKVLVPSLSWQPDPTINPKDDFNDWCSDTTEWLGLVSLGSPRILQGDTVDSHISRYAVPESPSGPRAQDLRVLSWTGLIPASYITQLLVSCLKQSLSLEFQPWFAITARAMGESTVGGTEGYTILVQEAKKCERSGEKGQAGSKEDSRHFGCFEFSGDIIS